MTRENKEYGGSDGDNGSGGRNGRTQNGEIVDIAGETEAEGEITSTDNFSRYQRLCGFGGGECCSVIRTLREKC